MPAIDHCEAPIIQAITNEGWQLEEKPYPLRSNKRVLLADCKFSRQDQAMIVVEVKCFTNPAQDLENIYLTFGQYRFYRAIIETLEVIFPLYLAIPQEAYKRLKQDLMVQQIIEIDKINLIIVDVETEKVILWIHW